MAYSSSRLTLYAVISAIEDDLRMVIHDHLSSLSPDRLFSPELLKRCLERLAKDLGGAREPFSTSELLQYVDFADSYALINRHSSSVPSSISGYVKSITPQLESVVPVRNRVAHGRPLNFDDLARVLELSDSLLSSKEQIWHNLREAKAKLRSDPSFVLGLSIPTYAADLGQRKHNLPQPDFDETGFLGREQQVKEVIRLCLGPYPVVTLSGEGGIGKTALALKVAYELLDYKESPFEAIVWATSKTTALTPNEIVRIQGAISDSLGLFQSVAKHLGGASEGEPLEEVLNYLREFKILLILDNLETVLDDRVKDFLQKMPSGSKLLITSRVGLGAFEFPYKVPSLQPGESVQLMRALAKIRGLRDLGRIPAVQLESFCNRMQNNPGWIKWFVSAVQSGRRPEEVVERSDIFLDFCMSNVYKFLTPESKRVLQSMVSVPGTHSQAELAFLNGMEVVELQRSLQLLLTTNFVVMNSVPVGASFESRYGVSDTGREFLQKHHPPDRSEHASFTKKKRKLVAAGEQIKIEEKTNPFSYQSIVTRSASDLIVARYLLDALSLSQRELFRDAEAALKTAKNLAPSYFEVHRVEAIVHVAERNFAAARDAYERAVEYEPGSAPVRFWFGNFLIRYVDDLEEAELQFKEAARLAPDSAEVKMELARVGIYRSQFEEASPLIQSLLADMNKLSEWNRRKVYDLILTFYQRRSDFLEAHKDWAAAVSDLALMQRSFRAIPKTTVDERMRQKLQKAIRIAEACRDHVSTDEMRKQADEILLWLEEAVGVNDDNTNSTDYDSQLEEKETDGTVAKLFRGFGFIEGDDGVRVFFHRRGLLESRDWPKIRPGSRVRYRIGVDGRGRPIAGQVQVLALKTTSAR